LAACWGHADIRGPTEENHADNKSTCIGLDWVSVRNFTGQFRKELAGSSGMFW
jgi:hypothetical protein